jgi:hypothetical protein
MQMFEEIHIWEKVLDVAFLFWESISEKLSNFKTTGLSCQSDA